MNMENDDNILERTLETCNGVPLEEGKICCGGTIIDPDNDVQNKCCGNASEGIIYNDVGGSVQCCESDIGYQTFTPGAGEECSQLCGVLEFYNDGHQVCCGGVKYTDSNSGPTKTCCGTQFTEDACCGTTVLKDDDPSLCCGDPLDENAKPYDPATVGCCNNLNTYLKSAQQCCGDIPISLNDTCCNGEKISENLECCGDTVSYNPLGNKTCCNGQLVNNQGGDLQCCGGPEGTNTYNVNTQCCDSLTGNVSSPPGGDTQLCCGDGSFRTGNQICCGDTAAEPENCCEDTVIDNDNTYCCNGSIMVAVSQGFNPCPCSANDNYVLGVSHCCGITPYDPSQEICCGDGDAGYDNIGEIGVSECCTYGYKKAYNPNTECCDESGVISDMMDYCPYGCGNTKLKPNEACCGNTDVYNPDAKNCCAGVVQEEPCSSSQSDPHVKPFHGDEYQV
tara:strand:+ start:359 stop:1705 length:1347 start_codon:yes stop_codon:yes gene_type:complete